MSLARAACAAHVATKTAAAVRTRMSLSCVILDWIVSASGPRNDDATMGETQPIRLPTCVARGLDRDRVLLEEQRQGKVESVVGSRSRSPARKRTTMAEPDNGPDDLILRYLREIDGKIDRIREDIADLKSRVPGLEANFAILAGQMATLSSRLDRIEIRLDRIERRLGLLEASP